MKQFLAITLFCFYGCLLGQAMALESASESDLVADSTLYTSANLIHPNQGEISENAYLWVVDGRFAYVGTERPHVPEGTSVLDLNGAFITPGFTDTHAHIGLGAVSFTIENDEVSLFADNQRTIAEWNANKLLEFGVTSIRNPGGDTRANLEYRNAQANGEIAGPRAFVAGAIINTDAFAGLAIGVDSETSITESVAYQAEQGVDYIKLYTGLNAEQVAIAVREADRYELQVIGHLESLSWQRGAELGIDNLVHAMPISPDLLPEEVREGYLEKARSGTLAFFEWFAAADLDSVNITNMIEALRTHDTSVDPTLIVFHNAFFGDNPAVTEHPQLAYAHPSLIKNWQEFYHFNLGWGAHDFSVAQAVWPKVLQFVQQLHNAGVPLSVGTDLGNPWVIPGVSYFQEMQLLAEAGIPPMNVLKSATYNGAQILGKEHELGALKEGYIADFVVFTANPAEDIANLNSLERVVQAGEVMFVK